MGSRRRTQVAGSDLGGVDHSGGGASRPCGCDASSGTFDTVPIAIARATKTSPFAIAGCATTAAKLLDVITLACRCGQIEISWRQSSQRRPLRASKRQGGCLRLAREAGRYSGAYRPGECWAAIQPRRGAARGLQPDVESALS